MMTNDVLQSMIDQYGDRIYAFALNNNKYLLIGYKSNSSPSLNDIELVTLNGVDFIKVHHKNVGSTKPPVNYVEFIPTVFVETVGVMDEDSADYRVDPLTFR